MVTANSVTKNILRYSILGLLLFLILLVASHGHKSILQFILTTLLILILVSLFEAYMINNPVQDVNTTVTNIKEGPIEEQIEEIIENMSNVQGQTFLRMNQPFIALPSNENNFDVPYDMRDLMIKKNNNFVPEDIDYLDNFDNNFYPNELQIGGDKFDYLQRGHIYDDHPGDTESQDNIILNPNFGKNCHFMQNDCNF